MSLGSKFVIGILVLLMIVAVGSGIWAVCYENEMKEKVKQPRILKYNGSHLIQQYDSTFVDTVIYDLMKLNTVGNIRGDIKGSQSYSESYFLGIGHGNGLGSINGNIKTTDYYVFYTKKQMENEMRIIRNKMPCNKVILVSKRNTAKFYIITTTRNYSVNATTVKYPNKSYARRVPILTVKEGDTIQVYKNKKLIRKVYKLLIDDSYITHI